MIITLCELCICVFDLGLFGVETSCQHVSTGQDPGDNLGTLQNPSEFTFVASKTVPSIVGHVFESKTAYLGRYHNALELEILAAGSIHVMVRPQIGARMPNVFLLIRFQMIV